MADTVVIEDGGDAGSSAEFNAGVATATAAQAAGEAAEAVATAEGATRAAGDAVDIAVDAEGTAWDARIAVDDLRGYTDGQLGEIRALLDERLPAAAPAVVVEEKLEVPAPEPKSDKTATPEPAGGEQRKKDLWWG